MWASGSCEAHGLSINNFYLAFYNMDYADITA